MAENEGTEHKADSHDDCCGGHCENGSESDVETKGAENGHDGCCDHEEELTKESADPTAKVDTDWKLQAAYLTAEIENMQKRFMREASDIRKYANEDILKRIVPVLDTLTLALNASIKVKAQPENESLFSNKVFQSFLQGVEMTAKQFEQVLQASGVEFINKEAKSFDPSMHEALGQTSNADAPDNAITEVFERGFKLGGRVIRPAKVMVNKV